ncbi:MAG: nuclease-related domain-containing protein [Leucobacter sp.]
MRDRFGGGRVGGIVAALAVDAREQSSTRVWAQGAAGEVAVGRYLDGLVGPDSAVLHDRRIPGSRANIDHLVVTPAGVWVVDTKRYLNKRPERYSEGGLFGFGATVGLKVGGRKRDGLIDGMLRQIEHVRATVGEAVPVRGVLCFIDADWPLIGGDFSVRGVRVLWPKRLKRDFEAARGAGVNVLELGGLLASTYRAA